MPTKYLNMQPKGSLIPMDSTYPEGLLAVSNAEGQPRIIVPPAEVKALILQTHEDIHHQNHLKVLHVLKATYYGQTWPRTLNDGAPHATHVQLPPSEENILKLSLTSLHLKLLWGQGNIMVLTSTD